MFERLRRKKRVQGQEDAHDTMMHVYAPAGKLGLVIDTPDDGAPVVHAIKEDSIVAGDIQAGDTLVAVDDVDVRELTAFKVSTILYCKSANPTRKITVIRKPE